jgi:hypothetical protein
VTISPDPATLTASWARRWPAGRPFADEFKSHYPQRWVRFHSLPGSKRYPDTEDEYATSLARHRTVLGELSAGPQVLVITADWTETEVPTSSRWPRRAEIAPRAQHWRTIVEHPEPDSDELIYTQLYVELAVPAPGRAVERPATGPAAGGSAVGPAGPRTPSAAWPAPSRMYDDDGRTRPIGGYARNLLTVVDDGTRPGDGS